MNTWLILRFGPLVGAGKHCPVRRLQRLAMIGALVAAVLLGVASIGGIADQLAQAQGDRGALLAQLAEAQKDRDSLYSWLNGKKGPVEVLSDGTRVHTRIKTYETKVRPVMVAAK